MRRKRGQAEARAKGIYGWPVRWINGLGEYAWQPTVFEDGVEYRQYETFTLGGHISYSWYRPDGYTGDSWPRRLSSRQEAYDESNERVIARMKRNWYEG